MCRFIPVNAWNPGWSRESAERAARLAREDEQIAELRNGHPGWTISRALEPGPGSNGTRRQGWHAAYREGAPAWLATIPELRAWLATRGDDPG